MSPNEDSQTETKLKRVATEMEALLAGARTVLEYDSFDESARIIFDHCRTLTGATSGYVALLTSDGDENEVLFLEAGGLPCTVDPNLPMPIRGLRETAYRTKSTVYDNEFMDSEWVKFMPNGHVDLRNVMFAPLVIEGTAVGLIGIANKPSDFTDDDAKIVSAFGELAALALQRSLSRDKIRVSEEHYRNLFESSSNGILIATPDGKILAVNQALTDMTQYGSHELESFSVEILSLDNLDSYVCRLSPKETKTIERTVTRRDGTTFPVRITLWVQHNKENLPERVYASFQDLTTEKLSKLKDQIYHRELEMYASLLRHDLGNDIQVLSAVMELLKEHLKTGDDSVQSTLESGETAITRMMNLLQAIGRPSSVTENNLPVMLKHVVEQAKSIHPNMGVVLEVKDDVEGHALLSSRLLPMVFENLLRNAAVHAGDQPEVTITLSRKEEGIQIDFADNGPGVDKHFQTQIFTRGASTRGEGMGLYLCKQIVGAIGGTIELVSTPHISGAVFRVILPILT